jgi:hypothetical protein
VIITSTPDFSPNGEISPNLVALASQVDVWLKNGSDTALEMVSGHLNKKYSLFKDHRGTFLVRFLARFWCFFWVRFWCVFGCVFGAFYWCDM